MDGCSELPVALYSLWSPVAGFKVLLSIHSWDRFVAYFCMESTRIEDLHNSSMAPVVISGFSSATLDLAKVSALSSQSWDMGPQLPKFLPRQASYAG